MTTPWIPPRRSYHLRVFAVALVVVVLCLVGVLFGLRMEAITHGSGFLEADDQREIRVTVGGVVELGWFEGEVASSAGASRVRVDRFGNGLARVPDSEVRPIEKYQIRGGPLLTPEQVVFHKLEAGDILWPEQPLAFLQAEDLIHGLIAPRGRSLRVPAERQAWLAVKVVATHGEQLEPGDPLAVLAPVEPATNQPARVKAVLDIDEKHAAFIAAGQEVRLYSTIYTQRLFGHADAVIQRVEPQAEPGKNGERLLRAHAHIVHAPFPLRLGSTVKAEIVVGKKQVFRVILEH